MALEWSDWSSDTGVAALRSVGAASPTAGLDARERHKLAERERRKSMRELFLSLHTLLPHSNTVRKEQSAILDEIIKYIPLAAARLRALQSRRDASSGQSPSTATKDGAAAEIASSSSTVTDAGLDTFGQSPPPATKATTTELASSSSKVVATGSARDYSILAASEPSASVSIRVREDRVNVSLTGTKGNAQRQLPSVVLDELHQHKLELVKSTLCRDGSKVIHHTESSHCDGLERSRVLLKSRLQDLACKLQKLTKTSSTIKRSFDLID
ncbi:hypothetical protein Syun_001984 [Stephania yunnanensis]|uniref:BHLH domain-containing protein n=1 Tax=Stephania yunnanensis TaxID=152371 RepID=A0AAP0LIX8_9MAGN